MSGEHPVTGQAASDMRSRMFSGASVALAFVSAAEKRDAIKKKSNKNRSNRKILNYLTGEDSNSE